MGVGWDVNSLNPFMRITEMAGVEAYVSADEKSGRCRDMQWGIQEMWFGAIVIAEIQAQTLALSLRLILPRTPLAPASASV